MQVRSLRPKHQSVRQRGTAYVLVLGITTLLVVMGIGGAMLGRVEVEKGNLQHDQAVARLAAEVTLDIRHKQLNLSGTAWRSAVQHDTWSAAQTYAGAQIRTKIVDEIDGDLTNNNAQPFRVYTMAQVGNAARVYSIEMIPEDDDTYTRNARTLRQEVMN